MGNKNQRHRVDVVPRAQKERFAVLEEPNCHWLAEEMWRLADLCKERRLEKVPPTAAVPPRITDVRMNDRLEYPSDMNA